MSHSRWQRGGSRIQLFQENPTVSESIAELEEEASIAAGMDIRVTSIVEKEKIKRAKTGDISVKAKVTFTFRPGLTERKPLKVTESVKLIGLLR